MIIVLCFLSSLSFSCFSFPLFSPFPVLPCLAVKQQQDSPKRIVDRFKHPFITMVRQTLSESSERNAMELPKYPGSCALREQPPPYMDVDLEQQHSTDPLRYENGSASRDSNRDETSESNICLSELYGPVLRCKLSRY